MKLLLLLLFLWMPADTLRDFLTRSQWKHRVLLLYAPSASSPELKRQRDIFASDPAGLTERDLVVRELLLSDLSGDDQTFLKQELSVSGNGFQVLLIGKDGGVKMRQRTPLALKPLYSTIDGMYMRQQEMKKRGR